MRVADFQIWTYKSTSDSFQINWGMIVLTVFRLIWNSKQTRPFAAPIQSVHGKYNMISVWFDIIPKRLLSQKLMKKIRLHWILSRIKKRYFRLILSRIRKYISACFPNEIDDIIDNNNNRWNNIIDSVRPWQLLGWLPNWKVKRSETRLEKFTYTHIYIMGTHFWTP